MQAPGFTSFIDPNDKIFMNSVNMGTAIEEYMKTSGQKVPPSATGMVRLILESLALKYRQVLDQLKQICPYPVEKIHIIGGGSRNYLLNQFTAKATGLTVAAGPYEGTAIGKLIVQAMADRTLSDLKQGRAIIKQSVKVKTFEHRDTVQWNEAYGRYREAISRRFRSDSDAALDTFAT